MGWKDWSSWLRHGIIWIIIGFFSTIIGFFLFGIQPDTPLVPLFALLAIPAIIIGLIWGNIGFGPMLDKISGRDCDCQWFSCSCTYGSKFQEIFYYILSVLISLIFFFLIGALIGWIIGKVKAKKEQTN